MYVGNRLKEIIALGYIPKHGNPIKFKDGDANIYNWLAIHKKDIIKLAETGDEDALSVCILANWVKPIDNKTVEERLKEFRELGYIPKSNRVLTKGINFGQWLAEHKTEIIKLADTNEDARWLCINKKWIKPDERTVEDILKEIREIGYIPRNNKMLSEGIRFGEWIKLHKEEIISLIEKNEDARWVCEKLKIIPEIEITIEEALKEIRKLGYIPSSKEILPNGFKIGIWMRNHKDEIIELSKTNEDAKWVCEKSYWNKSPDQILKDGMRYIRELGYIPSLNDTLPNGINIGYWLKSNRNQIITLSKINEDARWLCERTNWFKSKNELLESRIKEIRELGYVPHYRSNERFRDGVVIGIFIRENKKELIELSKSNEDAKWICEGKGWLESDTRSITSRIKEIRRLGYVPSIRENIRFSDGSTNIGIWVARNMGEIISLSETNEDAKWLNGQVQDSNMKRLNNTARNYTNMYNEGLHLSEKALILREISYVITKMLSNLEEFEDNLSYRDNINRLFMIVKIMQSGDYKNSDLENFKSIIMNIELEYDIPLGFESYIKSFVVKNNNNNENNYDINNKSNIKKI